MRVESFEAPSHVVVGEPFEVTAIINGGTEMSGVVGLFSGPEQFDIGGEYDEKVVPVL